MLHAFARMDAVAMGISIGCWGGLLLCGVTWLLVHHGDPSAVTLLALLSQYFPGFKVSWQGGLMGLLYGFLTGFALGWGYGVLRNLAVRLYVALAKLKAALMLLTEKLDQ